MDSSPYASLRSLKEPKNTKEPTMPISPIGAKIMQLNDKLNSLQNLQS